MRQQNVRIAAINSRIYYCNPQLICRSALLGFQRRELPLVVGDRAVLPLQGCGAFRA
ncbi:hypothetical protein [Sphingomonas faeni]|uniref:hypothetical protein n=1 Tax=Sphingomonas faeni TaxID=185950 RepID=UPI00334D2476